MDSLRSKLDDLAFVNGVDASNLLQTISSLPSQIIETYRSHNHFYTYNPSEPLGNIVICGLGGSGIGGELLKSYLYSKISIPIFNVHSYDLPKYVNNNSLLVAVSYSGNTAETLSCFAAGIKAGAKTICVTSGGRLMERAREEKLPVLKVPSGLSPRAALGYLFTGLLCIMEGLNLIHSLRKEMKDAYETLIHLVRQYEANSLNNLAKDLSAALHKKIPLIFGSGNHTEWIAYRWKTQFNENGKINAYANYFPELNHNEIVSLCQNEAGIAIIVLEDVGDHPDVCQQRERVINLLMQKHPVYRIPSTGKTDLARMWSLILLGDYLSAYSAILKNVDPTPIDPIIQLKNGTKKI